MWVRTEEQYRWCSTLDRKLFTLCGEELWGLWWAPEELLPYILGKHLHLPLQGVAGARRHRFQLRSLCSAPWKLLSPDHKEASETPAIWTSSTLSFWFATQPCWHSPFLPTAAQHGLGPSPACCWLFCFLGAAAVPLPAMGQRAEPG